jgi:hypothetical protein
MAADIPTNVTGRMDSFIEEPIQVFLDTHANREQKPHAIPLAIHGTSQPHMDSDKLIKRRGLLSDPKLIAKRDASRSSNCSRLGPQYLQPKNDTSPFQQV